MASALAFGNPRVPLLRATALSSLVQFGRLNEGLEVCGGVACLVELACTLQPEREGLPVRTRRIRSGTVPAARVVQSGTRPPGPLGHPAVRGLRAKQLAV